MSQFEAPAAQKEQEEGSVFRPKFNSYGLITAVACDASSGEVLMLAHMNAEALDKTITTGKAHYWSRSRKAIWLKGETSGNVQQVVEIRTDCDQDAIVMKVKVDGADASCHTGRVSCFYRIVEPGNNGETTLKIEDREVRFDPEDVYKA
ncbi:MAG: phosphoribosyl-AMP cyclohydrolase [Salaquimonas sp.]